MGLCYQHQIQKQHRFIYNIPKYDIYVFKIYFESTRILLWDKYQCLMVASKNKYKFITQCHLYLTRDTEFNLLIYGNI